ncbi:MAG: hypothetical protein ABI548_29155 [Polyangiaceae bacterium]
MNCFPSLRIICSHAGKMAVAAVIAFVVPSICRADPSPTTNVAAADENTRLQALFRKGVTAFEAGKDDEAVKILSEAWAIRQTYDIAGALAQTEISLKRYPDAAEHLDFGLKHFVPGDSEQTLQQMRTAFTEVKTHVAALKISVDRAGAEVHVDARTIGVSPLPGSAFVDPGVHTLEARLGGDKVSQVLSFEAGHEYPVSLRLGVAGVSAPPSGASTDDRSLVPVIIGGTVAVLGAVGLVAFDLAASSDTDHAAALQAKNGDSGCLVGTVTASDCAAQRDALKSHDSNRNLAVASAIVGAVGLVSIPVYWFWPRDEATTSTSGASAFRLRGSLGIGSVSISGDF